MDAYSQMSPMADILQHLKTLKSKMGDNIKV